MGARGPDAVLTVFTIAHGDGWKDLANLTVPRMDAMTGHKTIIVSQPPAPEAECLAPSWWKCWLFRLCNTPWLLYYDCDMLAMASWQPFVHIRRDMQFLAVAEENNRTQEERARHDLEWPYWNTGLFLAHKSAQPAMEHAINCRAPDMRWYEQTALNAALQQHGIRTMALPDHLNGMRSMNAAISKSTNYHPNGCAGQTDALATLFRKLI